MAGLPPPADLDHRVGFDQKLGAQIPMTLHFRDAAGRGVTLAELAHGKPSLLALGYYRCQNLCDLVLQGIARALPKLQSRPGIDYQVIFVSIDPQETPADARDAAHMLAREEPAAQIDRWHLLTGDQASIHALAQSAGFRYFHDLRDDTYAHAAGLMVLTGKGVVTQYLFGVSYPPDELRVSLRDASHNQVGRLIDRLVLFCCGYDLSSGRYSLLIERMMQGIGIGFVLVMIAGLYWSRCRART